MVITKLFVHLLPSESYQKRMLEEQLVQRQVGSKRLSLKYVIKHEVLTLTSSLSEPTQDLKRLEAQRGSLKRKV